MASTEALLIFARFPRLGKVKTRLRTAFSDAKILDLYRAFLADTLTWTARLPVDRFLYLADCTPEEQVALAAEDAVFSEVELRTQEGDDLGERMENAFRQVKPCYRSIVYLGADTPALSWLPAAEAFARLERFPVVIGPSRDGGYYLLGLSEPCPELFSGISWGTSRVLEQSLAKLAPDRFSLLPQRADVDTPQDVERLRKQLQKDPGRAPRTHAVLARV